MEEGDSHLEPGLLNWRETEIWAKRTEEIDDPLPSHNPVLS